MTAAVLKSSWIRDFYKFSQTQNTPTRPLLSLFQIQVLQRFESVYSNIPFCFPTYLFSEY